MRLWLPTMHPQAGYPADGQVVAAKGDPTWWPLLSRTPPHPECECNPWLRAKGNAPHLALCTRAHMALVLRTSCSPTCTHTACEHNRNNATLGH